MNDGRVARFVLISIVCATVLRVVLWIQIADPASEWRGDANVYRAIVDGLAEGRFEPRAWVWPPGFPMLAFPASFIVGSAGALVLVSMAAGVAIPLLLFRIARRRGEVLAGALAATFFAFSPEAVLASIAPLSDGPGLAVLLSAAVLAIAGAGPLHRALAAGAAAGFSVLVRPEAALAVPFVAWASPIRTRLRAALAYVAGAIAMVAPYVLGLHVTTGAWGLSLKPAMNIAKQEIYTASPDYASSRVRWDEFMKGLETNGALDVRRLATAVSTRDYFASGAAWTAWIDHAWTGVRSLDPASRAIAVLGAIGMVLPGPAPARALLLALSLPILVVPFFVVPLGRFLLPAFPALVYGLARVTLFFARFFSAGRASAIAWRAVTVCACVALLGGAQSFQAARRAQWTHRVTEIECELGLSHIERARDLLALARAIPDREDDLVILSGRIEEVAGIVAFREGRLDEARTALLRAERTTGPSARIDFNLGVVLIGLGQVDSGRVRIERAAGSDAPGTAPTAQAFLRSTRSP